jgi:transforming growth factor-beta-induced protein
VAAVDKAGLASALQDENASLTVLAPDNDAFAALLAGIGARSLDDVTAEQLKPILLYHVIGSEVGSAAAVAAATNSEKVESLGGSIQFDLNGETIELDEGIADIVVTDVQASNGIIHGISGVILPSIADVVVSDANFSILEAALGVADTDPAAPGLVAALDDNSGAFTVFAPPDGAFTTLVGALAGNPSTGISGLTDFQPYQLVPVLKYHVVPAVVLAADVTAGPVTTLGGVAQATTNGGVAIDGTPVTTANIITRNGVIHVVDGVLLPSITDVVTTAPEFSSLAGAVVAADGGNTNPKVAPALNGPAATGAFTLFAPSNAAFTALGNPPSGQTLTNVLLYHVLNQSTAIYAADALALNNATPFPTLLGNGAGSQLTVSSPANTVILDDAGSNTNGSVTVANYFTANGVIHVVDTVLLPQLAN